MSGYDCATCGACCNLSSAPERFGDFASYVSIRPGDDIPAEMVFGASPGDPEALEALDAGIECIKAEDAEGPGNGTDIKPDVPQLRLLPTLGFMRFEGRKCVAHSGEPGKCSSCTIYERRPQVCSEFIVGDPLCLLARLWAGIDPVVPAGGFQQYVSAIVRRDAELDPAARVLALTPERAEAVLAGAPLTDAELKSLDRGSRWSGYGWIRALRRLDAATGLAAAHRARCEAAVLKYGHLGKPVVQGPVPRLRRITPRWFKKQSRFHQVGGAFRRHYKAREASARGWKSDFLPDEPQWKSWRRRLHADTGRPPVFGDAPLAPELPNPGDLEKREIYDEHAALDVAAEAA